MTLASLTRAFPCLWWEPVGLTDGGQEIGAGVGRQAIQQRRKQHVWLALLDGA